jgi:hypothetical protein
MGEPVKPQHRRSRQMRFALICEPNDLEHWLAERDHPWTNSNVARMEPGYQAL